MRFVGWNLLLSAWLLVSAFALPHTPLTAGLTAITAFLVLPFAFLAAGKPGLRYVVTLLALMLGVTALLLPGLSTVAAASNAIVGAALFVLSLVRPTHAAAPEQAAAHAKT